MERYRLETNPEECLSTPNQNLQSQTSRRYQAGSQTPEIIDEVQICQAFISQKSITGQSR
jgi:hypothetical protein